MFRRRHPIPFWQQLRRWLWPRSGWQRAWRYLFKRLTRLPGTPHSIAAGFACGTAISFTPFIGFHLIGSALLALMVRGNYLAAWVGTLIGNPWTFPFIWVATYKLGLFLLGAPVVAAPPAESWTLERMIGDLGRLIWPMTVGGVPLGLVAGFAVYFPMARAVAVFQAARRRQRAHRRLKRRGRLRHAAPESPADLA